MTYRLSAAEGPAGPTKTSAEYRVGIVQLPAAPCVLVWHGDVRHAVLPEPGQWRCLQAGLPMTTSSTATIRLDRTGSANIRAPHSWRCSSIRRAGCCGRPAIAGTRTTGAPRSTSTACRRIRTQWDSPERCLREHRGCRVCQFRVYHPEWQAAPGRAAESGEFDARHVYARSDQRSVHEFRR